MVGFIHTVFTAPPPLSLLPALCSSHCPYPLSRSISAPLTGGGACLSLRSASMWVSLSSEIKLSAQF